jgi:hypothetical protein
MAHRVEIAANDSFSHALETGVWESVAVPRDEDVVADLLSASGIKRREDRRGWDSVAVRDVHRAM